MPRHGYKVLFAGTKAGPDIHRIRNFAEALHQRLGHEAIGTVPNMDVARDEVLVEVVAARLLGPALRAIRAELARSNFEDHASVVRLN